MHTQGETGDDDADGEISLEEFRAVCRKAGII